MRTEVRESISITTGDASSVQSARRNGAARYVGNTVDV